MRADFVTVPVLDARLQSLRAELLVEMEQIKVQIEKTKAELIRWLFLLILGSVAINSALGAVSSWLRS